MARRSKMSGNSPRVKTSGKAIARNQHVGQKSPAGPRRVNGSGRMPKAGGGY